MSISYLLLVNVSVYCATIVILDKSNSETVCQFVVKLENQYMGFIKNIHQDTFLDSSSFWGSESGEQLFTKFWSPLFKDISNQSQEYLICLYVWDEIIEREFFYKK